MDEVVLLVMVGGSSDSPVERMVAEACEAATLDTVERALAAPSISRIVVSTRSQHLAKMLADWPVTVDLDPPDYPFHFGRRLPDLIDRHRIERVLYIGGGSGALLAAEDIDQMGRALARAERLLIVNNFYSTDFAGWAPADALANLPMARMDNELGWLLGDGAGLPLVVLDRCATTQFDIDTPTDLMVIAAHPAVGRHLRDYLQRLDWDRSRLERAVNHFLDNKSEVIVFGRVAAATWGYLETGTACRTRIFAEERGMRADGRLFRAEARSLLGYVMEQNGLERGFQLLGELGDAAFIDSRVLWAHFAHWPSAADRFLSDLGRPDLIEDDWLRDFTSAALAAPIPVVLGGHSLVCGGLYALVEAARARRVQLPSEPWRFFKRGMDPLMPLLT